MHTGSMGPGWDGESDFYEDDESVESLLVRVRGETTSGYTVAAPAIFDIANAFLERLGVLDTYKLQKLCYYAQAEHLVRLGRPLFADRIEAWPAGPVIRSLWKEHRGHYTVTRINGGSSEHVATSPEATRTIETVTAKFGEWSGQQLSELTHREGPWVEARVGLGPKQSTDREIPTESIEAFYRALREIPADHDDDQSSGV